MRFRLFLFLFLISSNLAAQVDHWESVIAPADSWSYLVPTSEPSTNWTIAGYDDSSWLSGGSGFGYGDGDDNTEIEATLSVYLRKEFTIIDVAAIDQMILSMDFDDAFVAYINGVEVARANISGEPPLYNQASDGYHEALLYQGLEPEKFNIPQAVIENLNEGGVNVLAVQVHNQALSSSDLSALPVLSVGLNNSLYNYQEPPAWFTPPFAFQSSNLPVIVINTNGQAIVDEPKVTAEIGIIFNGEGERNSLTDSFNEYFGLCGIEIRGESSQSFAKKSYGIEMWDALGNDMDTSFLDFTSEEDFILHGPYSDKSLMNNVLAMYLGNTLGHYASQTRFVELVINDDYKGVYVLMEKIKRDDGRVDIAKLNPDEITGDDLTGGYIFRIDKGVYDGWSSNYAAYNSGNPLYFQFYYPDQDDIVFAQKQYIENYVDEFERAIASVTFVNPNGKHYLEYIDLRSFVDNFIINEYSKNVDAYRLSTYFHKDKDSNGGKLKAGPLWDFNLAFGNGDYCGGDITSGWEYYQCSGSSPFWWDKMLSDEIFANALRCRWEELRQTTLKTENINAYLDSMTVVLSEAIDRNFERWPILGSYVWPNPWYYANANSHDEIMGQMKNWLQQRSVWLDNNIPGQAIDCELYEPPYAGLPGEEILSLEDQDLQMDVYPNPVDNHQLKVESQETITRILIYNLAGEAVYDHTTNGKYFELDLRLINSGIYLLELRTRYSNFVQKIKID